MKKYEQQIIDNALSILEKHLKKDKGVSFKSPKMVIDFLRLKLECEEREVFMVMFLDYQNQLIEAEKMFFGTINEAVVYPREIARRALTLNASNVIISHNHPSGNSKPSQQDIKLTKIINDSLNLLNIKLLDHIIIGHSESTSLSESGEL